MGGQNDTKEQHGGDDSQKRQDHGDSGGSTGHGAASAMERMISQGSRRARALSSEDLRDNALLTSMDGANTYFWEWVVTVRAVHFSPNYSYVSSTTSDSLESAQVISSLVFI